MPVAQIDQNERPTWLLYNEITGLMEPARVDPVLGAVLVYGVMPDGNTPTALNVAQIDANDRPTTLLYNEISGLPEAARCGNGGELLIKVV